MKPRPLSLALGAALLLIGCQPPGEGGSATTDTAPPLAGARIGGPFTLIDQNGRTVSDRDFAGKYRLIYFGYTFCPDVCPTDVQAIGAGLKQIESRDPALAAKVAPIFITVDPERDTPAVLRQFVAAFHPRLVGLTGSPQAIDAVRQAYGIYAGRGAGTKDGYLVDHSRQTYLMGPDGQPIALVPADKGAEAVAQTIEQWVK